MPTTTNYGFYSPPLTGVTPNVPRDTQTLANAIDTSLKAEETARIAGDAMVSSSRIQNTAQSLATATFTAITFDTSELNEIPWTTNLWTVPTAGYYQINASLVFATNATGIRAVRILINGTVVAQSQVPAGSLGSGSSVSRCKYLAASDTVQIQGYQNSGGALTLSVAAGQNVADVTRVGR